MSSRFGCTRGAGSSGMAECDPEHRPADSESNKVVTGFPVLSFFLSAKEKRKEARSLVKSLQSGSESHIQGRLAF